MTNTVRKQKSGDQLAVGDWLAPGELIDGAAEVLFAHAWPASADRSRDNDGKHVQLVLREQGKTSTYADVVGGNTLFDLASDEDLAEYREAAERAEFVAGVRAFADWLEANPWVVLPCGVRAWQQIASPAFGDGISPAEGLARVRELAARLGVDADESADDRTEVEFRIGAVEYQLLTWHKDGRPAEPAPESAADPYAGVPVSELPEYREDDPTGLGYSRADDGETTQPIAGRVPAHFGAVEVAGGLVDIGPPGACPAHGVHPHLGTNGEPMVCLDCPQCRPPGSTV